MHSLRFLLPHEHKKYASWLKCQDADTLNIYFGYTITSESIDALVSNILKENDHHFIVVENEKLEWIGTCHIVHCYNNEIELGLMISKDQRKKGIGGQMLEKALVWCQNRGYSDIYLHCLSRNEAIIHLVKKYGLKTTNSYGETDAKIHLDNPTPVSWYKEWYQTSAQVWQYWRMRTRQWYNQLPQ